MSSGSRKMWIYKVASATVAMSSICLCGLSIAQSPAPHARNYYFSPSGDDMNNGDRTHPCRTLQHLNTLSLKAGDTVFLQTSGVFAGSLLFNGGITGTQKH